MKDELIQGLLEIDKRLKEAFNTDGVIPSAEPDAEADEEPYNPVDILQEQRNIERDYSKKQFPKGSRERVLATVQDVLNGAGTASLSKAYNRAKDDYEALKEMGDYRRAQIIVNQYMQERFLPAVEIVVNFTSPDELLNSKEALKELDRYALGIGSMTGYTAAYVREAYGEQLGQVESASSPIITHEIARLNGLLDTDQMQTAYALAKKLKRMIDDGKAIASEEDYNLVSAVATHV